MLGELHWEPFRPGIVTPRKPAAAPNTLAEYNSRRMREDLDALTESFVESYLEANPNMARMHGHA
jgi:hypothetical protein